MAVPVLGDCTVAFGLGVVAATSVYGFALTLVGYLALRSGRGGNA